MSTLFYNNFTHYRLHLTPCPHRLLPERQRLPVFQHRARVLEALQRHRVVVIAGETGSGKSTQIPQFILEEVLGKEEEKTRQCNVVVTQPRRISAMSLASRVNQELGSEDQPGSKVWINAESEIFLFCQSSLNHILYIHQNALMYMEMI